MALPVGYFYKDGFYWKKDESGPYSFDGVSTMTLLGTGGSVSGASGLGFNSDPTSAGASGSSFVVDGVNVAVTYTGSRVNNYIIDLSATDITRTVSAVDGYPIFSGNIMTSDGWLMTLAQMKLLNDEVLTGLGTAARGFKCCCDDLSYSVNAAGTTTYHRAAFVWNGQELKPVYGVKMQTRQTTTWSTGTGASGALRTIVMPGWLRGLTNSIRSINWGTNASGATGTMRALQLINGTESAAVTSAAATVSQVRSIVELTQLSATQVLSTTTGQAGTGATGATTVQAVLAIALATDITVGYGLQAPVNDSSTITMQTASLELLP